MLWPNKIYIGSRASGRVDFFAMMRRGYVNYDVHCVKSVQNTDQEKLRIWTIFTQWFLQIIAQISSAFYFSFSLLTH